MLCPISTRQLTIILNDGTNHEFYDCKFYKYDDELYISTPYTKEKEWRTIIKYNTIVYLQYVNEIKDREK